VIASSYFPLRCLTKSRRRGAKDVRGSF
jgi:hypothetical protein